MREGILIFKMLLYMTYNWIPPCLNKLLNTIPITNSTPRYIMGLHEFTVHEHFKLITNIVINAPETKENSKIKISTISKPCSSCVAGVWKLLWSVFPSDRSVSIGIRICFDSFAKKRLYRTHEHLSIKINSFDTLKWL